ncbi:unnamed protein product [Cylindrotheca closterium]|uniref:Cyclin-dependent kinase 2 homolog n=1 Tax=Cylindrotheca closterium TaxID=2856 RepID=A0AAD2CQR0_9STRA|nr:unnamed protein product [Cylindrotheca closterium]
MKRQRSTEEYKISPFGKEAIFETKQDGNPTFARGAFGELSLAIFRGDEDQFRFVAIKTLRAALVPSAEGQLQLSENVVNEVSALRRLPRHENIVSLLALYSDAAKHGKKSLSLAFPYYPCDLHTSLEWRRRSFLPLLPLAIVKLIAKDIFSALQHCHQSGILHRDLKPGNLLVCSNGVVKLCDFGIAKQVATDDNQPPIEPTEGQTGTKGLCTLYYRPPELLLGGSANHAGVDMYSAGVVVAEMVTGGAIFRGQNTIDQLSVIFDFLGTPTKDSWPSCESLPDFGKLAFKSKEPKQWESKFPRVTEDNDLHILLKSLVLLNPSKRLSARDVVQHPWFANLVSEDATRRNLRVDLIPPELREPILIDPRDQASISKVGAKLASRRRAFLTSRSVSQWESTDTKTNQILAALSAYKNSNELTTTW